MKAKGPSHETRYSGHENLSKSNEGHPLVSVVIVTYNSEAVIRTCISSLSGDGYIPSEIEIILVDNDSSDSSVRFALEENHRVRILQNQGNVGFSAAVNRAVSFATGNAILLLNPDATIGPASIKLLASQMTQDPSIGIIAPLLVQDEGKIATLGAGREPTVIRMFLHASGVSRFGQFFSGLEGHYLFANSVGNANKDVDWATGGCLMTTRATWDQMGGLSNRWFMYAEDIDFCLRVRAVGKRVVVAPQARAHHAVGGSSASVDGRINPAWIENLFDLYCTSIAPTRAHPYLWKVAVISGFLGRQTAYALFSSNSIQRKSQVDRYSTYASALWKKKSTYPKRTAKAVKRRPTV
jgi:hypothetical protein